MIIIDDYAVGAPEVLPAGYCPQCQTWPIGERVSVTDGKMRFWTGHSCPQCETLLTTWPTLKHELPHIGGVLLTRVR